MSACRIRYVGGPTALLEVGGCRLLTDPTFDSAGSTYELPRYRLRKLQDPAIPAVAIGPIDAVLLSHDHHFDNLDRAGRDLLPTARRVLTTWDGARRLGGNARALEPWQLVKVTGRTGRTVRITGAPARHGPADAERGPVVGFIVEPDDADVAVYVSGDTVYTEDVAEIGRRFDIGVAVLFMGAAVVREVGPAPLTFTAAEAVRFAEACPDALIVPLHFEGWAHFTESRAQIAGAFAAAGLADRLRWVTRGCVLGLPLVPPASSARDVDRAIGGGDETAAPA